MNTKKLFFRILALIGAFSLTACSTAPAARPVDTEASVPAARVFTDSLGREIGIDAEITRIAVTGPMAQIVVFALAPDLLVGISNEWDASAESILDSKYYNLPVLGQLYGGKGELNLEELLNTAPQLVIDVGESKDGMASDLDALQEQTGIPFVHIDAHIDTMGDTYRMLGELLNREADAEILAVSCEKIYGRTLEIANSVQKKNLLYITGEEGHNVIAKDSYHSEVIDLLGNNLAVVDAPSSKGTGNEVDMEQILTWNPDVIIFSDQSIYDTVANDPDWQSITAIRSGAYCEVPVGPYNWMGYPPSVQQLLGMMWMAELLYPEATDYDLYTEAAEYFKLFYHCELTQEQYHTLVANSLGK